jgi:hypothetical protein
VDRPSFVVRAWERIWHETRASLKGRFPPLLISFFGIAVGYTYSWFWLHKQTAKELVTVAVVSGIGANLIWFLSVFVVNTFRVPWLLDAESTALINGQEARAESAETKLAEMKAATDKHDLFSRLMQQGVDFSYQIRECQSPPQFASWDRNSNEWMKSVQQAMRDMGFPTDAVEFARAGEYAAPWVGVITTGSRQEERARVLEKHQENLADFVKRRLS